MNLEAIAVCLALFAGSARPAYLPDPVLSPGAVLPVTAAEVCRAGYAARTRAVTAATKRLVFRRYGIDPARSADYEVDHVVSLELGGSNALGNLFPQPYACVVGGRQYGARVKDRAEDAAHRAVCAGRMTLAEAQRRIAADWPGLYRDLVAPELPAASAAPAPGP